MPKVKFNRTRLEFGDSVAAPHNSLVKNSPGLFRASLVDAATYGGPFTQAVLHCAPLYGDRAYTVVDVKVHMLMPSFLPGLPGWHTDGVPRHPDSRAAPLIQDQDKPELRPNRYHLLVTGDGCRTEFLDAPLELDVPDEPDHKLYSIITAQVDDLLEKKQIDLPIVAPPEQWVSWDWWQLHRAVQATKHEWRYLIRITESDFVRPVDDLRTVMRVQQQVYIPRDFSW